MGRSSKLSQSKLSAALDEALARLPEATTLAVGLSGGRDSVALLHALRDSERSTGLRAVHVHHGLSTHADTWARFCVDLCANWNVPCKVVQVRVETGPRISVEAAARQARYAALSTVLSPNEVLATAHHADDQIESFFLQLLRGAGPRGLAAMSAVSSATSKRPALFRPLLALSRAEIDHYVSEHALAHIEDDSNDDHRFKRNALRKELLPVLERHFPDYRVGVLRSIALQQNTLAALDTTTQLAAVRGPLPLTALRGISPSVACEVLRRWLHHNELPLVPARRTQEAVRQLQSLTTDQDFRLALDGAWVLIVRGQSLHARQVNQKT
jgi:tRNA(Ile)-lysidine synthase